ncbi:PKD domain-containing protein [Methylovulum miyakonense]|uniref:PKD domain-containing protein n=1 Tax=Methylovulum miyakonense TaxID=645578 RepID=UPI0003818E64|nr:PKD domain-containing protein [Methylovulum miyakonense]
MGWQYSTCFKIICRLVLISFYFQSVNPVSYGYHPQGFDWPIGFSEAAAEPPNSGVSPNATVKSATKAPVIAPTLAPGDYLGSTPEANTSDPYIIQKATALNHDPAKIFQFVRDQIGNEVYKGSLRGARGTLWSKAGNALDKASLLVALLRVSGIQARYAQGTLADALSKQIINSMFKMPLNVVGCPDENAPRSTPDTNAGLLTEARGHFWVEYNNGSGFQAVDPNFPSATVGKTFTATTTTFAEIPDSLRHKVTVRLKRELYGQFAGILGNNDAQDMKTALERTFTTVELVGKPLSIGHFVNSSSVGGFGLSSTTNTYSPYFLLGQGDSDISDDTIIRGTDYQEQLTNFPLASTYLSGVFLEFEVFDANGKSQLYERTIADRIGYAARQNGGTSTPTTLTADQTLVTEMDIVTANILPGLQEPLALKPQQDRLKKLQDQYNVIKPVLDGIPSTGAETDAQKQAQNKAVSISRSMASVTNENIGMTFSLSSDVSLGQLEKGYMTKAYFASPRITLAQSKLDGDKFRFSIDLRKNDVRTHGFPGQVENVEYPFEMMRGLMESSLEGKVLAANLGQSIISIADVFSNVTGDNGIVLITPDSKEQIALLQLSADAKARITKAVNSGKIVATPTNNVTINGQEIVKWLETDTVTGHTISVSEDGGHSEFIEYIATLNSAINKVAFAFVGATQGYAVAQFTFIGSLLNGINDITENTEISTIIKKAKHDVGVSLITSIIQFGIGKGIDRITDVKSLKNLGLKAITCGLFGVAQGDLTVGGVIQCLVKEIGIPSIDAHDLVEYFDLGMLAGMGAALVWIDRNFPVDPVVFPYLSSDLAPVPALITPNPKPGLSLNIATDTLFTFPVHGGAEIPSVFKAQIRNTGPTQDTFKLVFSNVPAGFKAQSSIPTVTIPPGATAEVGVCVSPTNGTTPPKGTPVPFTLDVSSTSKPSVKATGNQSFTVPDIHSVSFDLDKAAVSTTPNSSFNTTLSIGSTGNASEQITLKATIPSGLHVTGLPASLALNAGETKQLPLTVKVDTGIAIGQSFDVVLTGDLAGTSPAIQQTATLHVDVRSAQGVAIDNSIVQASVGGNNQLPGVLTDLRNTLDQWKGDPNNKSLCERARLALDNIYKVASGDPLLSNFGNDITTLRNLVKSCDVTTLYPQVPNVVTELAQTSAMGVVAELSPNMAATPPKLAKSVNLTLKNRGKQPASVSLALTGLSASVKAALSSSTVTLAAGESKTVPITLTPSASGRFPFKVVATVAGFKPTANAYGLLVSANASVNIMSVNSSSPFILAGGTTQIQASIANTAGIPIQAKAVVTIKDSKGVLRYQSPSPTLLDISEGDAGIPFNLDNITAKDWANDTYTVQLQLLDQNNQQITGGLRSGILSVGTPIKASATASPIQVPPGNSLVTTAINVKPAFSGLGGAIGLVPTPADKDRINWAAASRGAKIQVTNPGPANGVPSSLIDELPGVASNEWIGVLWAKPSGSYLVDLGQARNIDTVQLHVWDGDNRYARFKVEGSLDNKTFFLLADRSTGEYRGVQKVAFTARDIRYIRITGLFDSQESSFYLYDEILAIGDDAATPVPTQTVDVDAVINGGADFTVGQKVTLNAGIYELKQTSGAVSLYPADTDNNGLTWGSQIRVSLPAVNKDYLTGTTLYYQTKAEAETAVLGQTIKLYLPVHADVYLWVSDSVREDNRGSETVEIRQISGPNDLLPVRIRDAMTRSVLWEQEDVAWWNGFGGQPWTQQQNNGYYCSGCHVQTQASTGLQISKKKLPELPIDLDLQEKFVDAYAVWQNPDAGWVSPFHGGGYAITQTSLWAWAVSRFDGVQFDRLAGNLTAALDWLIQQNPDGGWIDDHGSSQLYGDGGGNVISATHTAGNIQALSKALGYMVGKNVIALPENQVLATNGQASFDHDLGNKAEIYGFKTIDNITGIKVTVNDGFRDDGNFLIEELQAFIGTTKQTPSSAKANFSQTGSGIDQTIDGIVADTANGWAYAPQSVKTTPAQGLWVFNTPVNLDNLRITQADGNRLKQFTIEYTTDANPTLSSKFLPVSELQVGYSTADRVSNYRDALIRAANTFIASDWPYTRNIRTAAQTIIGLKSAMPYLSTDSAQAADIRIKEVANYLRSQQRSDGGWKDSTDGSNDFSQALPSAEALEALLLVTNNSVDPGVIAGAEYLLLTQSGQGSWAPPPGLARALASTTWVEIALPTIFENLASVTLGVDHSIPSNVFPVTGSFNPVPKSQTATASHWDSLLNSDANGQTFSFLSDIQNMRPGEVRQISNATKVSFNSIAGKGVVNLPPIVVNAKHILALTPFKQTIAAGSTATFNLTLENPFATATDFALSVNGLPDGQYVLPKALTLLPSEKKSFELNVYAPVNSLGGDVDFAVNAKSTSGTTDTVSGILSITEGKNNPPPDVNLGDSAVSLSLLPALAQAGQGTSAQYTLRVYNMGDKTQSFLLSSTSESSIGVRLNTTEIVVPPGMINYRDVAVTAMPSLGTVTGNHNIGFTAIQKSDNAIKNVASGVLNVQKLGVSIAFNQSTGNVGSMFSLRITNTGTVADLFDLFLGGPASLSATLSQKSVSLAAGAFVDFKITLGKFDWSLPGSVTLVGKAVSHTNTAVNASDDATINVAGLKSMSASMSPATQTLATPGTANFTVQVKNTGNIEDAYSAFITQVTGSATATLTGLDGSPAQSIPLFRLPGLASGNLNLSTRLNQPGTGIVKVRVSSTTNTSIFKDVLAQINVPIPNKPPVANAGVDKNVFTQSDVILDGSASSDPDGDLITYLWHFVSVPAGSAINDTAFDNKKAAKPKFKPDLAGIYQVNLVVSDGQLASSPDVVKITAAKPNIPPNALAGADKTVALGKSVILDGSASNDPDKGPAALSFAWSLKTEPEPGHGFLKDANKSIAGFSADVPGAYTLALRVFDGKDVGNDTMNVTVTYDNVPPVANAGTDFDIHLGQAAALNASSSHDPDNGPQPLSYSWSFVSMPTSSHLSNAAIVADPKVPSKASFIPEVQGDYILQVKVSDGNDEATDNILVKVLPALVLGKPNFLASVISQATVTKGVYKLNVQFTNTGPGTAKNVRITNLVFRTLSGTGTVSLNATLTASLPLITPSVDIGSSFTVPIVVNVASGVLRFSLTESGNVADLKGGIYTFSEVQSVIPK